MTHSCRVIKLFQKRGRLAKCRIVEKCNSKMRETNQYCVSLSLFQERENDISEAVAQLEMDLQEVFDETTIG